MLYLTGYLTQKKETEYQSELPEGTVALTIPMRKSDIFLKKRLANGLMKVLRNGTERRYLMLYGVVTAKVLRER